MISVIWFVQEMERIVSIAKRCNAWLLVDEVYRGAEHCGKVRLRPRVAPQSFVLGDY